MIHQFELYIFRLIQAYGWQKAKLKNRILGVPVRVLFGQLIRT